MSGFLEQLNSGGDAEPTTPEKNTPAPGDSPFLIGLQESGEAPSAASRKYSGAIALVVALAAAAGGLYTMRTVGLSANVALASTEIDYAAKHSPATVDHEKLIDDLHRSDDVVQIPLADLPLNPFAWNAIQEVEEPEPVREAPRAPQINPEELARREREREINGTLQFLELNSVMGGARPVVRISDQIYTVGDLVEGIFTVEKVEGRTVTLTADGNEYTLSIGE